MQHLDLFSGIGGFSLATEMVWGDEVEHIFCEIDPFCQKILSKHWPNSKIYGEIRTLTQNAERERLSHTEYEERETEVRGQWEFGTRDGDWIYSQPYILTGGFPCQPFSQAGRRRGTEDDRHLWPEMLRVIQEFHPRWVIGENVGGFVTWNNGMVLEQVHTDLESEGYEVQAFIIPAVAVNAPHRRDRVWIVAHSTSERRNNGSNHRKGRHLLPNINRDASQGESKRTGWKCGAGEIGTDASDARHEHGFKGRDEGVETGAPQRTPRIVDAERCSEDVTNTESKRLERRSGSRESELVSDTRYNRGASESWNQNWLEVATRLCTVDDGLPRGLARPDGGRDAGVLPRPKGWRNAALKGAGNAIVPQVAAQIMLAIKDVVE
ncbi:MAG: DNA (cytosine-5-)-methyltransferase [Candidatus Brocadiales bacterium]|nr:DNA (cytosine-5-)-methyltransferase [Candidatus Brocadiales bacterium]